MESTNQPEYPVPRTFIYLYQGNAAPLARAVVANVLTLTRSSYTVDDVMAAGVFLQPCEYFEQDYSEFNKEWPWQLKTGNWQAREAFVNQQIEALLESGDEKPEWMLYAEDAPDRYGMPKPTYLVLYPKRPEFSALLSSLTDFLNRGVDVDIAWNPQFWSQ